MTEKPVTGTTENTEATAAEEATAAKEAKADKPVSKPPHSDPHTEVPHSGPPFSEPPDDEPERSNPPRGKSPHKRKHKKKHYLLRILIVLVIIAGAYLVSQLNCFNVNGIAVIGNEGVTDAEVIKLSEIKMGESVFKVHPLLVQHKIKKNLYIESVNVNRKLPDKVEIIVKERPLLAQFHKDAKFVVTDSKGMVLDITKKEHQATIIEGVTVTGAEKKKTIELKETKGLERALDLLNTTDENDLFFKRVVFKGSKVDAYIYDELKCAGKYDNVMSAIKSGTLKKVVYDLYQKGEEKGTINVYNNDYCFFTPK